MSSRKKVVFFTPKIKDRKNHPPSSGLPPQETREKLFYRLEEVCLVTQLPPETIETWEEELHFLHSGRTRTGRKIFRSKDVEIILRLKELLEKEGMTFAGAKRQVEEEFGLMTTRRLNPEKLQKAIFEIREQLLEIQRLLRSRKK
ncbi:MerR family transcriptional regulator [Candidatus Aminicenantes bacterium AC-334-K16]|jgi:DNA-binding transcriptional MerR regulator|nr:MerR family transcriptional regulator [Candidatus Aminicenantes bacterium AC-334-K16]